MRRSLNKVLFDAVLQKGCSIRECSLEGDSLDVYWSIHPKELYSTGPHGRYRHTFLRQGFEPNEQTTPQRQKVEFRFQVRHCFLCSFMSRKQEWKALRRIEVMNWGALRFPIYRYSSLLIRLEWVVYPIPCSPTPCKSLLLQRQQSSFSRRPS